MLFIVFSRKKLKNKAKNVLRKHYWNLFFVLSLLSIPSLGMQNLPQNESIAWEILVIYAFSEIFIISPLSVGIYRYMLKGRKKGSYRLSDMMYPFKNEYLNVVKIMFVMNFYIFMWSLLLVVPGIVKGIEYKFIPYLLAEDTSLTKKEVFQLTRKQTEGIKFDIFVLDLSFMGWYLLGGLFFGIGTIFVTPYHYSTNIELFEQVKGQAI